MNTLHQHTRRRLITTLTLTIFLVLLSSTAAWAHPLGNFTTNRYSKITLSAGELSIFYVVDRAEIPTFRTISTIDANKNGEIEEVERKQYMEVETNTLLAGLQLTVNGEPLTLRAMEYNLSFPPGQGGLQTMRLEMTLVVPLPDQERFELFFRDENGSGALGWREIIVQASDDVELLNSTAPSTDLSEALTVYPLDMLQDPPTLRQATVEFRPFIAGANTVSQGQTTTATAVTPSGAADPFADLISVPVDGPLALILVLLAAFVWGAAHAMSPGHGKTIVAAYLVGSRGTSTHALFLGLTTTLTHTAGVFVLGAITLFASQYILPEQILPWLSVGSGLLVIGIGVSLFWGRLRPLVVRQARHHFHEHFSSSAQTDHDHSHDHSHDHEHSHDHGHSHQHHHGAAHRHGPHTHSHMPPGASGEPITWRSLLALGISGGLLPCPSALVVMLGAIALGRIGFGLLLILVFSLGLASVLTLVGILMVHAGKLFKKVPEGGRILSLAPIASALFITIAGVGITVQAILRIGSLIL